MIWLKYTQDYSGNIVGRFLIVNIYCKLQANINICVYHNMVGAGSTFAIIGLTIWPDLPNLNAIIKPRTVYGIFS